MKPNYHTVEKQGKVNERKLTEFLVRHGQMLLPMVQLVEQARLAVDEVIDVVGRKTIEAVLWLSAQQVAGVPQQGRKREGDIFWHGTQGGAVYLKERKLAVNKPRLRKKGAEVAIPAYQANDSAVWHVTHVDQHEPKSKVYFPPAYHTGISGVTPWVRPFGSTSS